MSTPEGNFETAIDDSRDRAARERAIDELQTANECDSLAELARMDDIEAEYRELAIRNLGHPQCEPTLSNIVDEGDLSDSLLELARSVLAETPDSSGAGP